MSRLERMSAQPTIARTMNAAARIDAISTSKLRRAGAKTLARGLSITVIQPGAFEVAYATARPSEPLSPRVSSSTPSPCFNLATKARFSGRAKLRSVTCCPARSITTRPSNPRSVVR